MIEFVTVTNVRNIEKGQGLAFAVNGKMVAIFFDGQSYHAMNDFCPHMGASLAAGHFEDGVVACPWHAWRFRVSDGAWCDNAAIKTEVYEVRVVGDEIQVAVPREDETTDITATDAPFLDE
jgi:nitrite reductase (NADH) small subunit/3-phenylpropionate/trans-cinnamate dioxygenase ferredoxin subunit